MTEDVLIVWAKITSKKIAQNLSFLINFRGSRSKFLSKLNRNSRSGSRSRSNNRFFFNAGISGIKDHMTEMIVRIAIVMIKVIAEIDRFILESFFIIFKSNIFNIFDLFSLWFYKHLFGFYVFLLVIFIFVLIFIKLYFWALMKLLRQFSSLE